jgi:hypothetical protein
VAVSAKGGVVRGLPTCTFARWRPAFGPRRQWARASPRLSVRASASENAPPSSAVHTTGTSESANPLLSATCTTTGSPSGVATSPVRLSVNSVMTAFLGVGSASATTMRALSMPATSTASR